MTDNSQISAATDPLIEKESAPLAQITSDQKPSRFKKLKNIFSSESLKPITFVISVVIIAVLAFIISKALPLLNQSLDIRSEASGYEAILSFVPSKTTVAPGEDFTVSVLVNTGKWKVSSAKLIIDHNPSLFTASSFDPGNFLPVISTMAFAPGISTILLDHSGTPAHGIGSLGTLHFTASPSAPNGTTKLYFNSQTTVKVVSKNFSNIFPTIKPVTLTVSNIVTTPTLTPTPTPTPTPTLTPTPTTPPSSSGVPCSSLSGIERRFPCSPLVAGSMPEQPTSKTDMWDMFTNSLYPGTPGNGVNERFSAVTNPAGSGIVIRNQNLLSDGENHTTVGTSRDLPNGSTECSAFRWLWKDSTEFNPVGWNLIWQLQMSGSPIVAVSVNESNKTWFFKSRNGSDSGLDITLAPLQYGHWAYFAVCTHIADAPNGWTKIWFRHDGWPDVNAAPLYERSGHDTYQGKTGHNTIGIYAGNDVAGISYYGYFDRYGRATTPQRAIQIAGNP